MIVKVGGSVADKLEIVFEALSELEDVKVVPGGWIFADLVETLNLNDELSHWMAILGMNLYGYYMMQVAEKKGFELIEPESFEDLKRKGRFIVLPYRLIKRFDELPHSWEVTSDSIAIWMALKLGENRLLKVTAVGGVSKGGEILEFATAEEALGVLDKYSSTLLKERCIELFVCSAEELKNYILGGRARGTFVRGD
ncbi:MAG: uridylate kinase [Archaeoglobaceae archaeon]